MNPIQRTSLALCIASALAAAHGAAGARSVTVSASGGPGELPITACTDMTLSVGPAGCFGFGQSYLSVDRTNALMDVLSGVSGRTEWTDPFSGIEGSDGRPYTPFVMHTDTQVAAGAGSGNGLFDARFGVSADGTHLTGTLTLLRAFSGPFILGLSGTVQDTAVDFSGIFLYTDSDFSAGDRIDLSLPNIRFTFPVTTIGGCGGGGGGGGSGGPITGGDGEQGSTGDSFTTTTSPSSGCTLPPPPSYAIALTGATIFEDPGRAVPVPVSGTLGLALAGLALLGWNRRQRAVAMAAR